MIEIFEGRLGGGKTYSAVERIANHLARGMVVCTNIALNVENLERMIAARAGVQIERDQIIQLTNEQIPSFHQHVPWGSLRGDGQTSVLAVVDEAHLYFNARDWSTTNRQLLAFLTQSAKVTVDIIFISQSALNIDKQFHRLVQYIWRFRDMAKWKVPGLGLAWPLNQILACQYDYDGNTLLQRWFRFKNKAVFGCYKTAALLTEFPTLEGIKTQRELKKVRKSNMWKWLIIGAVGIALIGAWHLKKSFLDSGSQGGTISPFVSGATTFSGSRPGGKVSVVERTEQRKKTLYDLYDERFVSYNGYEGSLKTEVGWYQLGEMSNRGLVVAVSDRRAKIQQPDGRTGWIVARDYPSVTGTTAETLRTPGVQAAVAVTKPSDVLDVGQNVANGNTAPEKMDDMGQERVRLQRAAKQGIVLPAQVPKS